MSVTWLPTPTRTEAGWRAEELRQLAALCAAPIGQGQASGWEVGLTERGEPQLYLLGPEPQGDCILSVSRLGCRYVLEDGEGSILTEHHSLAMIVERARHALRRRRSPLVAKIAIAWLALREAFEERVEPLLAEPVELLAHVAPQLAALA